MRSNRGRAGRGAQGPWRRLQQLLPLALLLLLPPLLALPVEAAQGLNETLGEDGDPCAALHARLSAAPRVEAAVTRAGETLVFSRPRQWRACLAAASVPVSVRVSDATSVVRYLQSFYSLLEIAKRSPDPRMPSKYNVVAAIQRLVKRAGSLSGTRFYLRLSALVKGLHDGHTQVAVSTPVTYSLPLSLVTMMGGQGPIVKFAEASLQLNSLAAAVRTTASFNAQQYYGAKLISIAGKPAWKYLSSWAYHGTGGYLNPWPLVKSAGGRFEFENEDTQTLLYKKVGGFSLRMEDPGDYLWVKLVRKGGTKVETVRIPWLAQSTTSSLSKMRTQADFTLNFLRRNDAQMQQHAMALKAPATLDSGGRPRPLEVRGPSLEELFSPAEEVQQPLAAPGMTQISGPNDLWPVFKLSDGKTGIVSIFSFAPKTEKYSDGYFLFETVKAFQTVTRSGLSQVLIDLRENGGGVKVHAIWLAQLLMGLSNFKQGKGAAKSPLQPDFHYIPSKTPLTRYLRKNSVGKFNPLAGKYLTVLEKPFTSKNARNFMYPWRQRKFGPKGVPGTYSSAYKYDFGSLEELLKQAKVNLPTPIYKGRIMLLSDGTCFSACCTFATMMHKRFGVKLVTVAPAPGAAVHFGGGCGGELVTDVEGDFRATWASRGLKPPGAPAKFQGPILGMRVQWATAFYLENESSIPNQFRYMGATGNNRKLVYNSRTLYDYPALYSQAAKQF